MTEALTLLKAFLKWCDAITALVTFSEDLTAHDREMIRLRLMELKDAAKNVEKELEQ